MTELTRASNWYQTRAHLVAALRPASYGGQRGAALCSTESNPVEVYDQAGQQGLSVQYWGHKVKQIDDLPLCKKCEKKAEKLGALA